MAYGLKASSCNPLNTIRFQLFFLFMYFPLKNPLVLEKRLSFINENQSKYCEYGFVVWIFKNINWEHVEFDDGSPSFYPF